MRVSVSGSSPITHYPLLLREKLERLSDPIRDREACGQLLEGPTRLAFIIAEREQRIADVVRVPVAFRGRRRAQHRVELVAQFQELTLPRFLADAGHFRDPAAVLRGH